MSIAQNTTQSNEKPATGDRDSGRTLRLAVIVGSVREGRFGPVVAEWFAREAQKYTGFDEVDVVDLADHELPLVFPESRYRPETEVARVSSALADRLAAADAFAVITPEYNHSFPASLKNAIDWFHAEWQAKPVGLVSYGGMGGGLRAVEQLRQVFAELHAVTVRDSVSFHNFWERFGDDGTPHDADSTSEAARGMLGQLAWWANALSEARAKNPYGKAV